MRFERAAWWFVAPALSVIAVFFILPVLAALAISLTDFDIYALADVRNLRFAGLGNYVKLLRADDKIGALFSDIRLTSIDRDAAGDSLKFEINLVLKAVKT